MKKLPHVFSLVLLLNANSGCTAAASEGKVPIDRLVNLPRGTTIHAAEQRLDTKLIHQFAEQRGTNRYDCLLFRGIEPPVSYYFIFANSNLARIVIEPPFAWTNMTVQRNGRNVRVQKPLPVDPDERIKATMQQPDLAPSEIASDFAQFIPKKTGSDNATPAFILTAPIWLALAPKVAAETRQVEAWTAQYNPLRIPLGASVSEVEKIFGKPRAEVAGKADEIIHLYGHKNPPNVSATMPQALVAIVFKEGVVTRILSSQFFPTTWHPLVP